MLAPYRNEKLAKIREALESAPRGEEAYVFRLFTEKVQLLLDWLTRVPEGNSDRVVLKLLDDLALYMRFLESAIHQTRIPYAVIEHTTELSERIDPTAVVLLRPQNHQTFDTRPNSLNTMLLGLAKRLAHPQAGYGNLEERLKATPDVYVVSYPKYLGDVFLTYPILGHEFGHILWQKYAVQPATTYLLEQFPSSDPVARAKRHVASNWAMEFFCDRVGMHLYGIPYLFALRFVLSPYPTKFTLPSFSTVVNTVEAGVTGLIAEVFRELKAKLSAGEAWEESVDAASLRLISGFNDNPVATIVGGERETSPTEGLSHPSPGRRFKELLQQLQRSRDEQTSTTIQETAETAGSAQPTIETPLSTRFDRWFESLSKELQAFDEDFSDVEYASVLGVAVQSADAAYKLVTDRLGTPYSNVTREPSLRHLYGRLRRWIPPCEVTGGIKPTAAEWSDIIYAGWVRWIEVFEHAPDVTDEADIYVRDHMDEYLRFVQESMDMSNLHRTYSLISALAD